MSKNPVIYFGRCTYLMEKRNKVCDFSLFLCSLCLKLIVLYSGLILQTHKNLGQYKSRKLKIENMIKYLNFTNLCIILSINNISFIYGFTS